MKAIESLNDADAAILKDAIAPIIEDVVAPALAAIGYWRVSSFEERAEISPDLGDRCSVVNATALEGGGYGPPSRDFVWTRNAGPAGTDAWVSVMTDDERAEQIARFTMRNSPTITRPGDPIVGFTTPSGQRHALYDYRGRLVEHTETGPYPVAGGGEPAISPGLVDGEALRFFKVNEEGDVISGKGHRGGSFTLVGNELERENARFFAPLPPAVQYKGQPWTPGQQELLARPEGSLTAYIFIWMGQSNVDGENQNAADALISDTPIYPNNALMLDAGPRTATAQFGSGALVPLIENEANRGGGADRQRETPVSGKVNHFIRDWNTAWGDLPTVVGMSIAIGGIPYNGNKKGTFAFGSMATDLAKVVKELRVRGFTDIRTVIDWAGGEGDEALAGMTVERMEGQLRQLRRDAGDIIRRITGEVSDPLVVMIQPSFMMPGASPWDQPVRQALVNLDREDGFVLAGPAYQYPMTGSAVLGDTHIHRGNLGKYSTGQQCARATMAELLGATWHGLKALTARWSNAAGNQITINCNSMGTALVEDLSGAIATDGLANKGFLFDDGSEAPPTIVSVVLSGLSIIINLSAKPVGPDCKIGYALLRNADQYDADGPVYGARGTIRDNAAHVRIYDGAPQYDWLPAFILRLNRP
jgi:hypothetical protein